MQQNETPQPDNTAVRTALWRALHLQVDAAPHIIEDNLGLKLAAPDEGWQQRQDMHPEFTKRLRAAMVARARFIEDLMVERSGRGISQYVILGAGLDTFAQRRRDIASRLQLFEIDQHDTLSWKRQRLIELGYGIPDWQHLVPVDFEVAPWYDELLKAGFDADKPAVVACTGVTLYLTRDTLMTMLRRLASFASGSVIAITFYLPIDLLDEQDKFLQQIAEKGAREAGTPFVSFFSPGEVLALAAEAGFTDARIVSTKDLEDSYFTNRSDGLTPASGEMFLVAAVG